MALGGTGSQNLMDLDPLDLTSLASRNDLPARVRQVLEGVLGLFSRNLERSLVPVLDEFEISLVRQANRARAGEIGQRSLESVRKLKTTRNELLPRLILALEDGVARLDQRVAGAPKKAAPAKLSLQDMELVGSTDLDESLTLQDIAARIEARHSLALYELGHRFAVLIERPAFDAETLPLGPTHVGEAMRYAAAALGIPVDHRVLLYEVFDRLALSGVGSLYAAANLHFVEQGIFRHLQVQTAPRGRSANARPSPAEAAAAAAAAAPAAAEPGAPARPGPKKTSTMGEDTAAFGLAAFEVASTPARVNRPAAPQREAAPLRSAAELRDAEQFKPVREWLAARRRALCVTPAMKEPEGYEPNAREVQSALAMLQVRSPPTIMLGGKVVHRTLAQLKQDLLNHLRHVTPAGQTLQLSEEDNDTIEVLGLLFDELMHTLRASGRTPSLLTRLQVPILRVALRDKGFFLRADHPARQLLNTIAETGVHWIDDVGGESDAALIERVQRTIERVNQEFDSDLKLLERINDELLLHMQSLARRADVAERRLVDAARGREKLALARETASRAIADRLAAAKPSRLLRTLLEQAWTDVLALTVLRQGEDSDTFKRQLEVADQLIAAGDASQSAPRPLAAAGREEIETGLGQVGYHEDEVRAVVDRLFTPERAEQDDGAISQTDLAMRLKSKMRLGETVAAEAPLQSAQLRQASLQLSAEETQMLERLRSMPAGVWFELIGKAPGDRTRLKLSWFSPASGRCLLVNQRGARVDECDLDHLARDIVAGRVRQSPPERESLVDRCWKAVVGSLRQFAASAQDSVAQP